MLFLSQWGLGVLKYLFSDTEFVKNIVLEIYIDNSFINTHSPSIYSKVVQNVRYHLHDIFGNIL